MKPTIPFLILLLSLNVYSEEQNCPKVESKGEGHWPLPPEAFTESRFNEAVDYLNEIVKVRAEGRDYYNVENELMYIKGYMLKLHNESEAFCEFIQKEAYVRH